VACGVGFRAAEVQEHPERGHVVRQRRRLERLRLLRDPHLDVLRRDSAGSRSPNVGRIRARCILNAARVAHSLGSCPVRRRGVLKIRNRKLVRIDVARGVSVAAADGTPPGWSARSTSHRCGVPPRSPPRRPHSGASTHADSEGAQRHRGPAESRRHLAVPRLRGSLVAGPACGWPPRSDCAQPSACGSTAHAAVPPNS
jgi:hypothetical protein